VYNAGERGFDSFALGLVLALSRESIELEKKNTQSSPRELISAVAAAKLNTAQ
jgi:hypothetical protein